MIGLQNARVVLVKSITLVRRLPLTKPKVQSILSFTINRLVGCFCLVVCEHKQENKILVFFWFWFCTFDFTAPIRIPIFTLVSHGCLGFAVQFHTTTLFSACVLFLLCFVRDREVVFGGVFQPLLF